MLRKYVTKISLYGNSLGFRGSFKKLHINQLYTKPETDARCLAEFIKLSLKSTNHTLLQQLTPSLGIKVAEG